jgi:hypothetical protein
MRLHLACALHIACVVHIASKVHLAFKVTHRFGNQPAFLFHAIANTG